MARKRSLSRFGLIGIVALAAALAMVVAACGGGDDEEKAVETQLTALYAAWNAKDVEGVLAGFTDRGLETVFDFSSREEAREALPEFIGETPLTLRRLSNTKVSGNSASLESEYVFGKTLQRDRVEFVKEGGVWKYDNEDALVVRVPSGVTGVDVIMQEFAFGYQPGEIRDGNFAFKARNIGAQDHELALARVPEGLSLEELLASFASEEGPAGFEFIGSIEVEPGEENNLVFTEALASGRYLMVCFLPDVDDPEKTPHALKGMVLEFQIK